MRRMNRRRLPQEIATIPNDISAKTRHVLITTTVKRSFPADIASRSFTWGLEIRIANPFIRANPIRRPSRHAGTARENHLRLTVSQGVASCAKKRSRTRTLRVMR